MAGNPDVHWLLFSDEPVADAPPNGAVHLCEFGELATRVRRHFDFEISLDEPYKLCDYRPAFGEIFRDELAGYDFWGHTDVDVLFGQIREHLPREAFQADKILFQGNFALYRNTAEAARWYRHEVGKVSYRTAFTTAATMHFDEWAGIYYIVGDVGVRYWHQDVIFDLSFGRYRTRDVRAGGSPRRYAWEGGEVAEYRVERGTVLRRTALLVHFQKRTLRPPPADVLNADAFWILPNRLAVQRRVSPWTVRVARLPIGHEIVPFYWRRERRLPGEPGAPANDHGKVQQLMAHTPRIRAIGTSHSFNRIADTDDDPGERPQHRQRNQIQGNVVRGHRRAVRRGGRRAPVRHP